MSIVFIEHNIHLSMVIRHHFGRRWRYFNWIVESHIVGIVADLDHSDRTGTTRILAGC